MPIASRSTAPSAPATPRSQRSWPKVKTHTHILDWHTATAHSSDSSTVVECQRASVIKEGCCFSHMPLQVQQLVFQMQLSVPVSVFYCPLCEINACSYFCSSSKDRPRFQGFPGWEKPQTATFIHPGVLPDQTHPKGPEVPAAAEGALLSHWSWQWGTLPSGW